VALTGLSQLPPSFSSLLSPHEEPLAWETVALWGENRIGRTGPPKAISSVDLNPVSAVASGPVDVDPGLFERWLGGVALTGHAGSAAAGLGRALDRAGQARLAVTTERVMLVQEGDLVFTTSPQTGSPIADQSTTELWSLPRAEVRAASRRSRPLMVGRLVVEFADSSTVALMCGMVSPRAAHRLRDALMREVG
jgi:hypothetical protein